KLTIIDDESCLFTEFLLKYDTRPRDRHPFPTRRSSDLAKYACATDADRQYLWHEYRSSAFCTRHHELHYGQYHFDRLFDWAIDLDRKSTRLNSSHVSISYAVFCLKKKIVTQ